MDASPDLTVIANGDETSEPDADRPEGLEESAGSSPGGRKGKRKPKRALPSPRLSVDSQLKVLKGFAVAYQNAGDGSPTLADVSELTDINASTISSANGFFSEVGLLDRSDGGGYVPTDAVLEYRRKLSFAAEDAEEGLAAALADSWCWEAIRPKLEMGPITTNQARSELGAAAEAGSEHQQQLDMVLEWLAMVGLIEMEGDQVRLSRRTRSPEPEETPKDSEEDLPIQPEPSPEPTPITSRPSSNGVSVSFEINVDMNEFKDWEADRISAFFNGIATVLAAKEGKQM